MLQPVYRTLDWAATRRYESSLGYGVYCGMFKQH